MSVKDAPPDTNAQGSAVIAALHPQGQARRIHAGKQAAILDALPAHIAVLDSQGRIASVNHSWRRVAGAHPLQPAVDGLGLDYLAICDRARGNYVSEAHQAAAGIRAVLGGSVPHFSLEYPCDSPTQQRWFLMTVTPLTRGRANGAVVMHVDVTERKQAEMAQRHSESRYRTLFEYAPDGILIADAKGYYIDANASSCRMLGYAHSELVQLHSSDVVAATELAHIQPALQAMGTTGDYHREWQLRRKDGSVFSAEVIGTSMPDGNLLAMVRDITERKRAEAALQKTQEDLIQSSRQAGMAEVATSVLHNVGNVLNSLNVSASVVMESIRTSRTAKLAEIVSLLHEHGPELGTYISSDPKGRHIPAFLSELSSEWGTQQQWLIGELGSLRSNIDHIKGIVAMQQDFAKVSGVSEIVDLTELLEDSLRMVRSGLLRHQVTVIRVFEKVPTVITEKHTILQILVNLLRNAKQASGQVDVASRTITVRIAAADGRIRISVSDKGVGIAPENLARIFSHGFTTRKDGHGFALHSGALAAKDMGGSLSAYSDGPGKGATFTLELPFDPAEPAMAGAPHPLPRGPVP